MFGMNGPAAPCRPGRIAFALVAGMLAAAPLHAQDTAAAAPQAQPAAASPYVASTDAVVLLNFIKADQVANFEMIIARLKEGLAKSEKPERKEQAANWRVFKANEAGPGGAVVYVSIIDPAVKGADYTWSTILAEAFPAEAAELYKVYVGVFATPPGNLLNLNLVQDLSK